MCKVIGAFQIIVGAQSLRSKVSYTDSEMMFVHLGT